MFRHLINIIFPITCTSCGIDLPIDDSLRVCVVCKNNIKAIDNSYCCKCGLFLPDGGENCFFCLQKPKYYFEFIRSYGIYDGVLKKLIQRFKYNNKDYLGKFLGELMISTINNCDELIMADCIIPVPMHWFKKLTRGYNQTELLAKHISQHFDKPLLLNTLSRNKLSGSQVKLQRLKRIENIKGCFNINKREEIKGKDVLLIDDVATTCSTLNECAKTLRKAGASKVYCLTTARD